MENEHATLFNLWSRFSTGKLIRLLDEFNEFKLLLSAHRRDAWAVRRATIQICKQWDSLFLLAIPRSNLQ
jgi:hypothetical protein